ncbi:hypothetical protein PLICRDRAFT_171280 [Plicaturopsis crispa FD-325 SS-3]|nr:hypothetical protein PLICRDRAFT_171280 [Plicaturopsis crispa FD-325 SS-3]
MATTASSRTPPPRRSSSVSSPTPNSIARGATARAAATPRVPSSLNSAASARRHSLKGATPPPAPAPNGETRETLAASLKQETDHKEQLLVQLQNKDQTITNISTENDKLKSALTAAETRINEIYADQGRMEDEMAARIEVTEKLRTQVREMEKEKRDIQRRYNEQTSTFEAERQAFYDNEQHLKSRIQSLTQARRQPERVARNDEPESEVEPDDDESIAPASEISQSTKQDIEDEESEPAEMTSLKLELSTLSTSYNSLQSTLVLLQTQLNDLKRVNHELQEENESYMILLREKTLSGQFDIMRQVGGGSSVTESTENSDDDGEGDESADYGSVSTGHRSTLDRVDEEANEETLEQELERSLEPTESESPSAHHSRHPARHGRKRGASTSHSPSGAPRGESLADLPITGPGLDLAAELGRAENKDILDSDVIDPQDRSALNNKGKRGKKGSTEPRKVSDGPPGIDVASAHMDVDALRSEVKSLKDANKALSLYASKIIDRIISQEGFEHVLAVDFEQVPATPRSPMPPSPGSPDTAKPRPQSAFFGRAASNSVSSPTTKQDKRSTITVPQISAPPSKSTSASTRASRRSLSFDWKSFSMFGGGEKKPENNNLRPLTLKPGTTSVTGARKLETHEDEEDRRERERLNATMKLMGIEPPNNPPISAPPMQKSFSSPATPASPVPSGQPSRFSFFRSRTSTENADASSTHSAPSLHGNEHTSSLTQEALAQAEAENSLAALDAHEQVLSAELARGSGSGFTEIAPRRPGEGRRSRRSRLSGGGSGSGSTVWSAGMSGEGEE